MKPVKPDGLSVVAPAVLAALTTWVALMAWAGFAAAPSGYLVPALGGVLLIAATGIVLRTLRVTAVLVLLAQAVVVALWLTHRWAGDVAWAGWLPSAASVEASTRLLERGVAASQSYAAPVPESAPEILALLLAAGMVVALLVDFLVSGLRRVPAAGLPLLAVYTAPVSILDDGVPWWVFALGAIGFLALLVTEEGRRLQHWGRQVARNAVADSGDNVLGATSMRISARRIGLTAVALAVLAPTVVPTLGNTFLTGSGAGGEGPGDSVTIDNPMVDLKRDLVRGRNVEVLTIRTPDADPSYLRISVLDTFDGSSWKPSERDLPVEQRASGRLPAPPGLDPQVARREVSYDIDVEESFDSTWLPSPYPVTRIEAPGDWRYDSDTFDFVGIGDGTDTRGIAYSLTALEVAPTAEDLFEAGATPQEISTPYTELPDDMPDTITDLARDITAGTASRYERAVKLQSWFREDGGFEYSLEPDPGNGTEDLESFLSAEGERKGYCEQFAAAMAVMGRTLGIPSRVAVGFLEPTRVADGEYVYRAHDLHAWPEMYFDGAGWVRFEPTPNARAGGVPGYTTEDFDAPAPEQAPSASAQPTSPEELERNRRELDPGAAAAGSDGSGGTGAWRWGLGGVALLGLLGLPWLARRVVRRRRWDNAVTAPAAAEAGWRELKDTALDLRLPWNDAKTLRTAARALASHFGDPETGDDHPVRALHGPKAAPQAALALERLVRDVERARYSRAATGAGGRARAEVRTDVELCAAALRAGVGTKNRRWATLLPASLYRSAPWGRTSRMASGLGDVAVDRAV